MNLFSGHVSLGSWSYTRANGDYLVFTPNEIRERRDVQWIPVEGSGEFYWPHIEDNGELIELDYDEQLV